MLVLLNQKFFHSEPNSNSTEFHELFLIWQKPSATCTAKQILKITRAKKILTQDELKSYKCFVGPRAGTISPWSSKATEICKNSSFHDCEKLERVFASKLDPEKIKQLNNFDKMVNDCFINIQELEHSVKPKSTNTKAQKKLKLFAPEDIPDLNKQLGLALSTTELDSLIDYLKKKNRNISDAELMMFSQINSEHCRHKIFNARWKIDGIIKSKSLFQMIQNTMEKNPNQVLSAYKDNAAVIKNNASPQLRVNSETKIYYYEEQEHNDVLKVETHNHPTAISPFPGAATGSGGEIRDESATGLGARSKAGIVGFSVSNLRIPALPRTWECNRSTNPRFSSALKIMLEAPIGSAAYNNEFGRPSLNGFFRSYEALSLDKKNYYSYDKPIMLAGGIGTITMNNSLKHKVEPDMLIVVLGGPSMLIGLGGGSASSLTSGTQEDHLDFSSVQRGNAEMQRRAQEVLNTISGFKKNIIESIHDVGAGGLSNAVPEIINDSNLGGIINLNDIPSADPALSPMELWCNESQERYVLIIKKENLKIFRDICKRERAPFAVIGKTNIEKRLQVIDSKQKETIIDLPLDVIFRKEIIEISCSKPNKKTLPNDNRSDKKIEENLLLVLGHPTVADKRFLITIGDRSVGGLTTTDQMAGPWQVPISNCAVIANSFSENHGTAVALGERGPVACIDGPGSARVVIAETITNLLAADIERLKDITISANWMCASDEKTELPELYSMVEAVGLSLCPKLGINIPVGKDSMSMKTMWKKEEGVGVHKTISPTTLVCTGTSKVKDTRKTLSPYLTKQKDTILLLIDLGLSKNRLGGSILDQVSAESFGEAPDVDKIESLVELFNVMKMLRSKDLILAYHDRSDGGLFTTVAEMAFGGRTGVSLEIPEPFSITSFLMNEEIGVVIQVENAKMEQITNILNSQKIIRDHFYIIGSVRNDKKITIRHAKKNLAFQLQDLLKVYSETTISIQKIRDNSVTAEEELEDILDIDNPGLFFDRPPSLSKFNVTSKKRPKLGILREQGVNGQNEMAAAFTMAGFDCIDIHMQDLMDQTDLLKKLNGLALAGGFSYGDVLGAGSGWANTILFNNKLKDSFSSYFENANNFTFGVCNGCQTLSQLKSLIPGANGWPTFDKNKSNQFESRLTMVEIIDSPSIFLRNLAGVRLPIVIAHGEGRVTKLAKKTYACMRYIDNYGSPAEKYPANPNGSIDGLTAFTSSDGRATIMMPHPERVFLNKQFSWHPDKTLETESTWIQIFYNARRWLD